MQTRYSPPNSFLTNLELSSQVAAPEASPRHILEEIVWHKQQEVSQMREKMPLAELQKQVADAPSPRDFLIALQHSPTQPSLIAEVKKASPSKGVIRADFDPRSIAQAYERGGATCLSVLTDQKFFQGSFNNLHIIRQSVALPLLCKEFIIDSYQIYLARVAGADAVLLIAAILSDQDLQEFLKIVHSLGMNALVEVHNLAEVDRVLALKDLHLVGINNRNLEDFTVDIGTTQQLIAQRQEQLHSLGITIVSESGLHTAADLALVHEAGVHAVLIGESLVKQNDVEQAVINILNSNTLPITPEGTPSSPSHSMISISDCLNSLRERNQCALIPFITAGDPDLETTAEALRVLDRNGANLIELGVPYSDPLADGPVIQAAATRALQRGTRLDQVLEMVQAVSPSLQAPLILFTYYNPILNRGIEKFLKQIASSGVRGLVVPDLPLEEAHTLLQPAAAIGIEVILLVAPTSSKERIEAIALQSQGFIYLVSVTGVTGVRTQLQARVKDLLMEIRGVSNKPIGIGFGISDPEQARQAMEWGADAVIVGSAFVKRLADGTPTQGLQSIEELCRSLKAAITIS